MLRPVERAYRHPYTNHSKKLIMTKKDLIEEIAFSEGLTRSEATKLINAAIACVENALVRSEDVRLSGFCTMTVKDRPAKNYRNSTTGEICQTRAGKLIQFRAAAALM